MLDARNLDYRTTLHAGELESPADHPPGSLVLAQGGTTIHRLNTFLAGIGKSLAVTGASNGSTIAGAISTGLHGSVPTLGAMQDQVRALHLVTGPNRHVWLEPASNPIVSADFASHLGAELIRDDAMFAAALVSLGSFGIIHGVVLEVVDLFWLRAARRRLPLGPGLLGMMDTLDFSQLRTATGHTPHHFEVMGGSDGARAGAGDGIARVHCPVVRDRELDGVPGRVRQPMDRIRMGAVVRTHLHADLGHEVLWAEGYCGRGLPLVITLDRSPPIKLDR